MKRSWLMTTVVTTALLGMAGCGIAEPPGAAGSDTSRAPAENGALVVGSAPSLQPLEFVDENNEITGLIIDLIDAAAAEIGMSTTYESMSFDALIPALQSDRIDLVTSMGDLPERRGTVTFIDYLQSGAALLVPDGNPEGVSGPEGLCGLRVAFSRGTAQQVVTEEADAACRNAGEEPIKQAAYGGSSETVLALRSGQADAAWTDTVNAAFVMDQTPDTYEIAYKNLGNGYGIGFPKEDVELREKFMAALEKLRADGTYEELVNKYGLEESILDEFTVNRGEGLDVPESAATPSS